MSLTKQDLTDIRNLFLEAFEVTVNPRLEAIEARLDALENRLTRLESEVTKTNLRLSALEVQGKDINGRLTAIENDVKELYKMIKQAPRFDFSSETYKKLSNSKKIRILDREVTTLAKKMDVKLSRP